MYFRESQYFYSQRCKNRHYFWKFGSMITYHFQEFNPRAGYFVRVSSDIHPYVCWSSTWPRHQWGIAQIVRGELTSLSSLPRTKWNTFLQSSDPPSVGTSDQSLTMPNEDICAEQDCCKFWPATRSRLLEQAFPLRRRSLEVLLTMTSHCNA